jgi:hypothetical protein
MGSTVIGVRIYWNAVVVPIATRQHYVIDLAAQHYQQGCGETDIIERDDVLTSKILLMMISNRLAVKGLQMM